MQIIVSWKCLPVNFHFFLEYLQFRVKKFEKQKTAMKHNITTQVKPALAQHISV